MQVVGNDQCKSHGENIGQWYYVSLVGLFFGVWGSSVDPAYNNTDIKNLESPMRICSTLIFNITPTWTEVLFVTCTAIP